MEFQWIICWSKLTKNENLHLPEPKLNKMDTGCQHDRESQEHKIEREASTHGPKISQSKNWETFTPFAEREWSRDSLNQWEHF